MAKDECLNVTKSISRVLVTVLLGILLLSSGGLTNQNQVKAASDEVRWSRVNIPRDGDIGKWMLAAGSDVRCLTIADDGTLYCYADPSGTDRTLFKSTDSGSSWSYIGGVTDIIVDIAVVPGASNVVYYATASGVYKSVDAGLIFCPLQAGPGGAGNGNKAIVCIDVYGNGNNNIVAAGIADSDSAEYGGVYILDESEAVPAWTDTSAGNCDTCALAFSPQYSIDGQMIAVVTDELDAYVTSKTGNNDWNQVFGRAAIPGVEPLSADIVFPDDYDASTGDYTLFVAIDTGSDSGDVYKIDAEPAPADSTATDLNIGAGYSLGGVDVTGLAASGNMANTCLFAGSANCTHVYYSYNGGINWNRSVKQPTGQSDTFVVVDNAFSVNGKVYAATGGVESAFSCSTDGGSTWNQSGLIDAAIGGNYILDLAVSPDYIKDNTLFMLTFDGVNLEHSVWRSTSGGEVWERVINGTLSNIKDISMVRISPTYGTTGQTVFLAGTGGTGPAIWKSTDNGQSFTYRSNPLKVDAWTVVNDDTLFSGSYNGSNGLVYKTEDGGLSYSTGTVTGIQPTVSIAVSPNYLQDGTILVGNTHGWVYYSIDNGISFRPLPLDAVSPPLSGSVNVVFDSEFDSNNTIYAAGNTADEGIYRFIIGQSDEWQRIGGNLPSGGTIDQLAVSDDGVLYAVNSQSVDNADKKGGMERSLNPSFQLSPTIETVVRGLDDGVTLDGLWLQGSRLWSIDTQNTRLMTFLDTLTQPVILRSPGHGTAGSDTSNIVLDWEVLNGATAYRWQLDYDSEFSAVPADFEGDTGGSSVRLPELDTDTVYHWRVKATEPVLSRWSDRWSFRTVLGQTAIVPALLSPGAGAELVSLKPLFQWSAIDGAEKYELLVSHEVSFDNPVIKKTGRYALPITAWKSNISLDYGNTYYWKVRAVGSGSYSDWSAVSVFVTESAQVSDNTAYIADAPVLLSPGAGSGKISLKPLFQWDAIVGARSYELVVSGDTSFDNPVILKDGEYALPTTAWKSNVSLDYGTAYYWKVRALVEDTYSDWSPVSAFSTEAPPDDFNHRTEEQSLLPSLPPSSTPEQQTIPEWVAYLGIGLLITTVLLQVAVLLVLILTRYKMR